MTIKTAAEIAETLESSVIEEAMSSKNEKVVIANNKADVTRRAQITQDNALINASYTLDIVEKRLILLAIARAAKSGKGITANDYLEIHADDYVECFNVTRSTAYKALKSASVSLFDRYFTYESITKKGNIAIHKARWTQDISYVTNESTVKIVFGVAVAPFITDLKEKFTSYYLNDIKQLTSVYAIRLYELIIAWREIGKTHEIALEELRDKLGILEHEYERMSDFKKRVLETAIKQINKHTNIEIKAYQHKKGRSISGFSFSLKLKKDDNAASNDKPKKRKMITKAEAEKMAKVGESWENLLERLKSEYIIKFDKPNKWCKLIDTRSKDANKLINTQFFMTLWTSKKQILLSEGLSLIRTQLITKKGPGPNETGKSNW